MQLVRTVDESWDDEVDVETGLLDQCVAAMDDGLDREQSPLARRVITPGMIWWQLNSNGEPGLGLPSPLGLPQAISSHQLH